jgi:hypothetical protein
MLGNSVDDGIDMKITNVFGTRFNGAIGKTMIASTWKGKEYIRAYAVPHNPRTERQQEHRAVFAEAVKAWKGLSLKERKKLDKEAREMTGFNLYVSRYIKRRLEGGEAEP